jgi:hypothetical protein
LVVTITRSEGTVLGIVGSVVGTTNSIEDVLAEICSMCASRVTSLETESMATHEVMPFNDLLEVVGVTAESIGIEETTERVTTEISTMRVEFTSCVRILQVNLGLINEADNLNVVGSPHELNALEGASREDTGAVTGLGAPGNLKLLGFSNGSQSSRRSPKTEVLDGVQVGCLAEGVRALSGSITTIVTVLRTTNTDISVGVFGQIVPVETLVSEGSDSLICLSVGSGRDGSNCQQSRKSVTRHFPQSWG